MPAGYAISATQRVPLYQCSGTFCSPMPLDPPAPGEDLALEFYVTGLSYSATTTVLMGGELLPLIGVEPVEDSPGVDRVTARVPADFRLRGYLPLTIASGGEAGNQPTVRIRATPPAH